MTGRRAPSAAITVLLALLGPLAGCPRQRPPQADAAAAPVSRVDADPYPSVAPATLPVEKYVGAAACAGCHAKQFQAWEHSPHGRAMALPTRQTVLGEFDGKSVRIGDPSTPEAERTIIPSRETSGDVDSFWMTVAGERFPVDLVLGSGRQHQLYATRSASGSLQMLPAYWATKSKEWLLTSRIMGTSIAPNDPMYWKHREAATDGSCFHCHLSQGRTRSDGKQVETTWVDLSINCEACHGPGRDHVAGRAAGRAAPYSNLRLMNNEQEGRLCARCHSTQHLSWDASRPEVQYLTLASGPFRADTTQGGPAYQWAGHVSSGCYLRGAATCSGCHDPHAQKARSLDGKSAEGASSNNQCTDCHRNYLDPAAAKAHSHHKLARCIDCHMPLHWIKDTAESRQRVSDHSISIPHPAETLAFGLPNACNECHSDHDAAWSLAAVQKWKQLKATVARSWVRAFWLFARRDPYAKQALVEVLGATDVGPFQRASALEGLSMMQPDASLAPALAPFSESPDPMIRAYALRALWTHDAARRDSWLVGAASDEHPLVRSMLLAYSGVVPLPDAGYDALTLDIARQSTLPTGLLFMDLAFKAQRAGQMAAALRFVNAAAAHATPIQSERAGIPGVKEQFAAEAGQKAK